MRTDKWLNWYLQDHSNFRQSKDSIQVQKRFFVEPLVKWFDEDFKDSLHSFLLEQGLFAPKESRLAELKKLAEQSIWQDVQECFVRIKARWNGPDVPIYILPVDPDIAEPTKKAGLSFPFAVILFIGTHLTKAEIEALFIHEYHHTVRLSHTNRTEDNITFLESMYMEGLAECAVLEMVGSSQLAHWTSLYKDTWKPKWVEKWIVPNLDLIGRSKHRKYLYGQHRLTIPPMLGYYFGYQLARTSCMLRPDRDIADWLAFTGDECEKWLKEVIKSMTAVE
ncbi:DUF2268 domain-containing protein [Alkalicoccobacillus porphyridii]|uniref:DUF2268 domain-containing protein n=1 Tax=Alkalicoccobacillus porphyridii TaxID=2597270 RepID=UPI0021B15751|nr:DUF2268 domain-containing protein [Alkalicoccobacillus porphyridii]